MLADREQGKESLQRVGALQNKRGLIVGLYAAVGLPLVLVLYGAYWLWQDFYGVADHIQQIEEGAAGKGVTFDLASFLGEMPVEGAQDGWAEMQESAKVWAAVPADTQTGTIQALRRLATPIGTDSAEDLALMSSAKAHVDRYKSAVSKPTFFVQRDWTEAARSAEPVSRELVELSRLVVAYAEALAGTGRLDEAMRTLDSVRQCGARYSADGGLDALSIHVLLETMALTGACDAALFVDRGTGARALSNFVADQSSFPDYVRCLEGEAIRTVSVLKAAESYGDKDFCGTRLSARGEAYQKAGAARMMEFWQTVLPDARSQATDASAIRDTYYRVCEEFVSKRSASGVVAASIANWHRPRLDLAAALQTKYALVAVMAEMLGKDGSWPDTLPTLRVDAIDEYSGGEYKYSRTEDGFVVYSVGKDRRDDQGSGRPGSGGTDIVVAVYRDRVTIEGR